MKGAKTIFLFAITVVLAFACEKGREKKTTQYLDSLQTQFSTLNDSVNTTWKEMIDSDDLKLRYGKRLLQEISYSGKYNVALHDSLANMLAAMPKKRYNNPQQLTSDAIDNYDRATEQFKSGIVELSTSMPGFEACSLCQELLRDIEKADNDVLTYRIRYDQHVQAYNDFIKANKEDLIEINPDYKNLKVKPLFQLTL